MDVGSLEAEAKAAALRRVENLLKQPDKLEQIEQYKRECIREKASVEARLKSTMQSKMEGVRTGLNQLVSAIQDNQEIKDNSKEIEGILSPVPHLVEKLKDVCDENVKHSQYAAAVENLNHIFTVPESVERTKTLIKEEKFLLAHQGLSDLENSRDDLLYELFKSTNQNETDTTMLKQYFRHVEELSDMLAKQLWLILSRLRSIVSQKPAVIVTVLRIIEREEKSDELARQQQLKTTFIAPGRPKAWKEKAFSVLKESVQQRVEGNQFEERKDNAMWLVRHLEVIRIFLVDDLQIIKSSSPCFPPHYNIVKRYVQMYHECLSSRLQDIAATGLEGNEFITLLTWRHTYDDMMKQLDLTKHIQGLPTLLDNKTVDSLQAQYLAYMKQNFESWMRNTIESEMQDWYRNTEPESDGSGFFHTSAPVTIFQMTDQNLHLSRTVGNDMVAKTFNLCMSQVINFGRLYEDAIKRFKFQHFEDRSKIKYYTSYMVAIINNCLHFIELSHQLRDRYWQPGFYDDDATIKFKQMVTTFNKLRDETSELLLDEVFLDLQPHFQDLMTRKWLTSDTPMDTICVTLEDYCQDYQHLRPKNFDYIMEIIQRRVAKEYVLAILLRRISFRSDEERAEKAVKIVSEVEKLQSYFRKMAPALSKTDSPYDILIRFSEVLKVDKEILSLELTDLLRKYPDMAQDQLSALLFVRGDIGRLELKQMVPQFIPDLRDQQQRSIPRSVLSEIKLPVSIIG